MYKLIKKLDRAEDLKCPRCGGNKINRSLSSFIGIEDVCYSRAMCCECEFEGYIDHFIKTAEITRLKNEHNKEIKLRLERIWFKVENDIKRYDYGCDPDDGIWEKKDGGYVSIYEILGLIDEHLVELWKEDMINKSTDEQRVTR